MRHTIRTEIESITPLDPLEAEHRADALAWVDSGAQLTRLVKPSTPPKHLVAFCVVIDERGILLADHKDAQLWLPSGGHVEADEHPRTTATRELAEELGLSAPHAIAAPVMITCRTAAGRNGGHSDVALWYVVKVTRRDPLHGDPREFHTVRWFDFASMPERADPNLPRLIRKLEAADLDRRHAPACRPS
jgi:8-oxo-dGTP pyrophosphatase MutT (NUDIX family)